MLLLLRILRKRILAAFRPVIETSATVDGNIVTISVSLLGAAEYTFAATIDDVETTPLRINPWQWTVEVPFSTSTQTVAWTASATNDDGEDTSSGTVDVEATVSAPGLSDTSATVSERLLTVSVTASGNPPPVLSLDLTVGGSPATATEVSRGVWTYLVPGSGSSTSYSGTVTADNGIGSDATYNFSGSVDANSAPSAFGASDWILAEAPESNTAPSAFGDTDWELAFDQPEATAPGTFQDQQWVLAEEEPDVQPPPSGTVTAPTSFTATVASDRSFTLTWSPPSSGTPARYDAEWRYDGDTTWNTVQSVTSPYTLTNLPRGGQDYNLRVVAVDGSGGKTPTSPLTRTTHWRPYGLTAEWNLPVADILSRGAHPNETYLRDVLWQGKQDGRPAGTNYINFFNRDYTYAVYRSSDATTTATCNVSFGNWRTGQVPWNPSWTIPDGTDAQFVILDEDTGVEYNAWQVQYNSGSNTITPLFSGSGRVSRVTANADESGGAGDWRTKTDGFRPSRGCGVQYYAMLITPEEIAQGKIYHALSCVMRRSGYRFYVRPAYKGERFSGNEHDQGVPQGTRFWFDVTDTEIDNFVASWPSAVPTSTRNTMKIVFRAMRDYGIIATDQGGDNHIQFQHDASTDWTPYGLDPITVNGRTYPQDAIDNFINDKTRIKVVPPPDGQICRAEWAGQTPFAPLRLTGSFGSVNMTNAGQPLIAGGTSVGSVMTITRPAQFIGEHPLTVNRNWQRNGVNIPGATGTTYTRVSADSGASIRCRFIAINNRGQSIWDSNAI